MDAMLSVSEIARRLNKSPRAITRLILNGSLAALRVGRTFRVGQADMDAYLERARVRPKAEVPSERLQAASDRHRHEAAERRCMEAGI
jgi:excisionase family DNA binding protein